MSGILSRIVPVPLQSIKPVGCVFILLPGVEQVPPPQEPPSSSYVYELVSFGLRGLQLSRYDFSFPKWLALA